MFIGARQGVRFYSATCLAVPFSHMPDSEAWGGVGRGNGRPAFGQVDSRNLVLREALFGVPCSFAGHDVLPLKAGLLSQSVSLPGGRGGGV